MSAVRVILLVIGVIIVVFGATMYTENQDFLAGCPGRAWGGSPFQEENCRVAAGNVIFGLLSVIVGMILIILGMISLWTAGSNRMKAMQNCPHCHTTITRQSSPKDCANCGSSIDWANPLKPQK